MAAVALGAVALGAVACGGTDSANKPAGAPAAPSTTRPRVSEAEAWCKKLDQMPETFGAIAQLKPDDAPKLLTFFGELRDLAPADAKPDFEVLLDFMNKANEAQKAGTLGTNQAEVAKWATDTFGPDAITKFKDSLTHILTVQANNC